MGGIERMIITIVGEPVSPAYKFCALFKGTITLTDEIGFRNANLFEGITHCRPSTLANTNSANSLRFDQCNFYTIGIIGAISRGDPRGCNPACAAAANDHDMLHSLAHHTLPLHHFYRANFI